MLELLNAFVATWKATPALAAIQASAPVPGEPYAGLAPEKTLKPYGRYNVINGTGLLNVLGLATRIEPTKIQTDIFAGGYAQAVGLIDTVCKAFDPVPNRVSPLALATGQCISSIRHDPPMCRLEGYDFDNSEIYHAWCVHEFRNEQPN